MDKNISIVTGNETVTSNKKGEEMTKDTKGFPKGFNVEEFRNDIISQLDVNVLKQKYKKFGFESRMKIESFVQRLSQMDDKFYRYKFPEVIRGKSVYESADGFVKINDKVVEQFNSLLKKSRKYPIMTLQQGGYDEHRQTVGAAGYDVGGI